MHTYARALLMIALIANRPGASADYAAQPERVSAVALAAVLQSRELGTPAFLVVDRTTLLENTSIDSSAVEAQNELLQGRGVVGTATKLKVCQDAKSGLCYFADVLSYADSGEDIVIRVGWHSFKGCGSYEATFFVRVRADSALIRDRDDEDFGDCGAPTTLPLIATLLKDVDGVRSKLVSLAMAVPAERYDWRPAPGIRSVREVMLHVASENYLLPSLVGTPAPSTSGIDVHDGESVNRFEKRSLSRDSVVAELDRSFVHLANSIVRTGSAKDLSRSVNLLGKSSTVQETWVLATVHLHEHLGQMIAYARFNDVVPPWSR